MTDTTRPLDARVIGGGPAGLMAAGELARAGYKVAVIEAKPTLGRKFLMAGKSGLNLTKAEPLPKFLAAYGPAPAALKTALADFGPQQVTAWANALGQPTFTGSSGRVFPKAMKASPLLRAWVAELQGLGVEFYTQWTWQGGDIFDTPMGTQTLTARTTVLALGGASWARLGSNGAWAQHFPTGHIARFQPANMGFRVAWSAPMARHYGAPVKAVRLTAGDTSVRAEFVISRQGIEGGGVYAVSRAMRDGAPLTLDLLPDLDAKDIARRLDKAPGKQSLSNRLRKTLGLDAVKIALLNEFGRPFPADLARLIKALPVRHQGPRPLDQAISTAGGLRFATLNDAFMLIEKPGWFAAGEMLDWEAPTGGYLLTACMATGRRAGLGAVAWLSAQDSRAMTR